MAVAENQPSTTLTALSNAANVLWYVTMLIALSNDLRWRIVQMYYYKEIDCKETADLLYVHLSTILRVLNRYNEYEIAEPVQHRSSVMPLLGRP